MARNKKKKSKSARKVADAFREVNANEPAAVAATREKKGAAAAEAQRKAIALSKARAKGARIPKKKAKPRGGRRSRG